MNHPPPSHDGDLSAVLEATDRELRESTRTYDAVVIGAGAAGGLAALLLTEAGLRVLVLDAGWPGDHSGSIVRRASMSMVRRLADPRGLRFVPPRFIPHARAALSAVGRWRQPIQSACFAWQHAPDAFVDDLDCPYTTPPDRPFAWIRARGLGGRMRIPQHGRLYFRLGESDLAPFDGLSPAWPFPPHELDASYIAAERRLQLFGARDNLPWLPDSVLTTELRLTKDEEDFRARVQARWPHARAVSSRYAPPLPLAAAASTCRLSCRRGAIAKRIDVDDAGQVRGVVWLDRASRAERRTDTRLVFLCASALESTRLLMLSGSPRHPRGVGVDSGVLGRYLMDHIMVGLDAEAPALVDWAPQPGSGRCLYLPRFDARSVPIPQSPRGFGVQVYRFAAGAGRSYVRMVSFGEMLPTPENHVALDPVRHDAWAIPILRIECHHSAVDLARARDQAASLRELVTAAGFKATQIGSIPEVPGYSVHECGTARMGTDPTNSVLDPHCQCWDARGLYVTDGAAFPSQGSQNPTLTIMALTARACAHAVR